MKNVYRSLMMASVLIFLTGLAGVYAQKQVVKGKVTDPSGTPLPGVTIIVKGTTIGTSTDAEGAYALEAEAKDVLVFSFIGYASQEITIGAQSLIDVSLKEDVATLQEIVVVGYGTQKKALNTGANFQVKGEDLFKQSTTNVLQALQGQTPGVQISSTSGQPGEAMKVMIRGAGSIAGNNPLYVVDGVLTGDISYLSNADIQSVDVLKDAASAAIYGSQASNGVVLITTKKGKSGAKAQITFDAYYGVQNVAKQIPMLNAQEYATLRNEAAVNSGKVPYYTQDSIAHMGAGTNWLSKTFANNAPTSNYAIGISGGNETSVYSASLAYVAQAGIVGGANISNYDRYNFRFNSEHKLYKDKIIVGENLTFAHTDNNGISVGGQYNNALRGAFQTNPLLVDSPTDTTGLFNQANPYRSMVYNSMNANDKQRVLGNFYIQVEPIKNLTFRTTLNVDYETGEGHAYLPKYKLSQYSFNTYDKVSQSMYNSKTLIFDNLLSYGFNKGDNRFDIMVGSTAYQSTGNSMYIGNTNSVYSDLEHAWINSTTNKDGTRISINGSAYNPNKRLSFYGRVNYNFKETILLNATFRADGSSNFAPGHQWGYFPSVSAGWVMTNSSLLDGTKGWLEFLKLRGSWGRVGNQNAGAFQYLALIQTQTTNYTFGPTEGANGLTPGAYNNNITNPNLQWEISQTTDFGFDARFLNGKLSASFDWYDRTSFNWLVHPPLLATAGANAPWVNGGNVTNRGIELAITYNNRVGDLNYRVSVNGAHNVNNVTNVPTADGIIHPDNSANQLWSNAPEFYRVQANQPMGFFWGYKTNGVFQTEAEVASYRAKDGSLLQANAQPGDVRYVDTDGNGVIDSRDKTKIGNPWPSYTFGFSIAADYKGFDLSVQANGVLGNDLVQSYRDQSSQVGNYTSYILDRWHGPGSSNSTPRLTEDNRNFTNFSDLYVHKGDFLRISNVTLGYNLSNILKTKAISQFRIYVAALNLFTFTKYTGMDPEIGYSPDALTQGVDLGYYPRPRTFMAGVNIKF